VCTSNLFSFALDANEPTAFFVLVSTALIRKP
jgi:hypothetical protein